MGLSPYCCTLWPIELEKINLFFSLGGTHDQALFITAFLQKTKALFSHTKKVPRKSLNRCV